MKSLMETIRRRSGVESERPDCELGVAGNATTIITANKKDFRRSELSFPSIKILNPVECLTEGRVVK